jgi:hypothetical protein
MKEDAQRPIMSQDVVDSGHNVSVNGYMKTGGMNIRGHINGRQFLTSLATGLVVGLGAALEHFVRHPELLRDAMSPVAAAMLTTCVMGAYNWYQGKTVEEIVEGIVGGEADEDRRDP